MHDFLHFACIIRLNSLDFLEVKLLNSHIFMSYVDARTYVKCNERMDENYPKREEENGYFTFLRSWSSFYTFLGDCSSHSTFLGGWSNLYTF